MSFGRNGETIQEERNKSGSGCLMKIYLESVLFLLPRDSRG